MTQVFVKILWVFFCHFDIMFYSTLTRSLIYLGWRDIRHIGQLLSGCSVECFGCFLLELVVKHAAAKFVAQTAPIRCTVAVVMTTNITNCCVGHKTMYSNVQCTGHWFSKMKLVKLHNLQWPERSQRAFANKFHSRRLITSFSKKLSTLKFIPFMLYAYGTHRM